MDKEIVTYALLTMTPETPLPGPLIEFCDAMAKDIKGMLSGVPPEVLMRDITMVSVSGVPPQDLPDEKFELSVGLDFLVYPSSSIMKERGYAEFIDLITNGEAPAMAFSVYEVMNHPRKDSVIPLVLMMRDFRDPENGTCWALHELPRHAENTPALLAAYRRYVMEAMSVRYTRGEWVDQLTDNKFDILTPPVSNQLQ